MPFQDIDDEVTAAPRVPSTVERWLHKIFLEDWALKLLALAITITLWLAVTGQNKPMTLRVSGVQLNFMRPDGFDVSNELPQTVDVILTGSKDKLDRISPRDLTATVDLTDQKPGERVIKLALPRVNLDLQEDVKIQSFHPAAIPIRLEPVIEGQAEVEVKLEGNLPDNFAVKFVTVTPQRVRIRGTADRVNALKKVLTESVWLDAKRESFDLSNVEINVSDPKIEVIDPAVNIHVEISEKKPELLLKFVTDSTPYLARIVRPSLQL